MNTASLFGNHPKLCHFKYNILPIYNVPMLLVMFGNFEN